MEAGRLMDAGYRAIFERSHDGILLMDAAADTIIEANPRAHQMLGYGPGELVGLPVSAIHPHEMEKLLAFVRRVCAEGHGRTGELSCRTKRGETLPVDISAACVDSDGSQFLLVMVRDVSELRRAATERARLLEAEREARVEAERRAAEERSLRAAVEAVSGALTVEEIVRRIARGALGACAADGAFIVKIDSDRGHVEVVAAAGEVVPSVGAERPYAGSFAHRVIQSGEPELVASLADTGRPLPGGIERVWPDASAIAVPLVEAGEVMGALILLRKPEREPFGTDDVGRADAFGHLVALAFRKVRLIQESEERHMELERVVESRASLIRGFTHDVRNALAAGSSHLQLLEANYIGALSKDQGASVSRIRRSVRSALGLIDDLLELAHLEAGELILRRDRVDPRAIARDVVEEQRPQARSRGLHLAVELPEELPAIESDEARVRQILGNLISNAIKYTPEGGRVGVAVGLRERGRPGEGQWMVFDVRDTGLGIPPEAHEECFDEFRRLAPHAGRGAGLGLAISRRLARALGGDITLESEAGRGAVFTLWLRRRPGGDGGHVDEPGRGAV